MAAKKKKETVSQHNSISIVKKLEFFQKIMFSELNRSVILLSNIFPPTCSFLKLNEYKKKLVEKERIITC